MTHTPEPWYFRECTADDCDCGCVVTEKNSRNNDHIVIPVGYVRFTNAKRIVACVNACAGISTEELSGFGLGGLKQKLDEIEAIKDAKRRNGEYIEY